MLSYSQDLLPLWYVGGRNRFEHMVSAIRSNSNIKPRPFSHSPLGNMPTSACENLQGRLVGVNRGEPDTPRACRQTPRRRLYGKREGPSGFESFQQSQHANVRGSIPEPFEKGRGYSRREGWGRGEGGGVMTTSGIII